MAFDVAATSPVQFTGPPPYLPSKIIAAGDFAYLDRVHLHQPVEWAPGWAALGERSARRAAVADDARPGQPDHRDQQPTQVLSGVFPSPAAVITPVFFLLPTTPGPAAGADPWLIEANVTVYVDIPAKPFAAFATKFYDFDNDPGSRSSRRSPPGGGTSCPTVTSSTQLRGTELPPAGHPAGGSSLSGGLQAAELGGAAQRVGHPAGGPNVLATAAARTRRRGPGTPTRRACWRSRCSRTSAGSCGR